MLGSRCSGQANQTIEVSVCTSLEELEALGCSIYPNPSDETLFVENKDKANSMSLSVYDLSGNLLHERKGKESKRGACSPVLRLHIL